MQRFTDSVCCSSSLAASLLKPRRQGVGIRHSGIRLVRRVGEDNLQHAGKLLVNLPRRARVHPQPVWASSCPSCTSSCNPLSSPRACSCATASNRTLSSAGPSMAVVPRTGSRQTCRRVLARQPPPRPTPHHHRFPRRGPCPPSAAACARARRTDSRSQRRGHTYAGANWAKVLVLISMQLGRVVRPCSSGSQGLKNDLHIDKLVLSNP